VYANCVDRLRRPGTKPDACEKEFTKLTYTRRITPKRVTSLRCPFLRHSVKATQLLL